MMITRLITKIKKTEYSQVMQVWEASVRSAFHFWTEEDLLFYRETGAKYLDELDLFSIRDEENNVIAFMGISNGQIDVLFVHPDYMGKGLGSTLIKHALSELNCTKIDVNEQNDRALKLYEKLGFKVVGRAETDSGGRAYPILHLEI